MAKYQGRFNQNRGSQDAAPKKEYTSFADLDLGLDMDLSFLDEIELEQEPAPTRKSVAAQAPAKKPAAPTAEAAPAKKPVAKKPAAPAAEAAPVQKPAAKKPAAEAAKKKQKKGPRVGGVIFYTLYFLFILVFFIGTYIGLQWLNGWLTDYEQSQPVYKAEAVFQQLFTEAVFQQTLLSVL